MTKQTLQDFLNKDVKVVDAFGNCTKGVLINLTEDSAIVKNDRKTVVISLDYIARLITKNTY